MEHKPDAASTPLTPSDLAAVEGLLDLGLIQKVVAVEDRREETRLWFNAPTPVAYWRLRLAVRTPAGTKEVVAELFQMLGGIAKGEWELIDVR